jgi:ABC-type Zn uptake system ZnuABC Zn-binding protein ZnuA
MVVLLVAVAVAEVSCSGCARRRLERPQVAATVFPLYDITRRLAGDRLDVHLILSPGLDAHSYDPRPRDVASLADSSLIFAVGLGLDGWAHGLARSAGAGEARVFEIGPLMDPILAPSGLIRDEPFIDAHFWLDPLRARRAVDVIVEALGAVDPRGSPFYRSSGEELKRSFQAVHEEIAGRAERWPRRRLVTFHGSLFYFADRYDLDVVGVVEPVPGQEPTAQHLAALIDLLRAPEPAVLFSEPQMDNVLAEALAREAGVVAHEVDPMGGQPGTSTYEQLMRHLLKVMNEALR